MKQYEAGKQIKIICEDCLIWELDNRESVSSLLLSMCDVIGMQRLGGPYIEEVKLDNGRGVEDGISGLLMIMQSHLSLHCWSHWKSVRITVDSCQDFDEDLLVEMLINKLLPMKIRVADEVWRG